MRSTTLRRMAQVCRVHDTIRRQTGLSKTELPSTLTRSTLKEQCIGRPARPFRRSRSTGDVEKRGSKKSPLWPLRAVQGNELSIPASSAIFVGIDPDIAGALGLLRVVRNPNEIALGDIRIVDMPSEIQIINRKKRRYVRPVVLWRWIVIVAWFVEGGCMWIPSYISSRIS